MSDVNQKCVSLATGALGPDLRMNYEFGLVLGVDEFRQEQLYFLEKSYLHNRALHGYGTVYGLDVTATRPGDNARDVLITVQPGMGIDQYGRAFVLRDAQCARLGAWLAAQEQKTPGIIAQHRGASADMHVYVVASYDSCADALVPIAGQPCASSDSTQAASRTRDAYDIQIRWDPPPMPAWEAVRRFSRLMAQVRLVPGLPLAQSDEAAIIAFVRDLDQPGPFDLLTDFEVLSSPPQPVAGPFRLPEEGSREALDRIFTVWVTEVRPKLAPDLSDPAGPPGGQPPDAAILLARLDFVPEEPFDVRNPGILDPLEPVDEGRPFLLHTGLIQELLLLGGGGDGLKQKPVRQFATLFAVNSRLLLAWVHHPAMLDFVGSPQAALRLRSGGQQLAIAGATVQNNLFTIEIGGESSILPGTEIELRFQLRQLRTTRGPLFDFIETLPFDYVGRADDVVVAYGVAGRPAREFVSFATDTADGRAVLHAWFHLDAGVTLPDQVTARRVNQSDSITFTTRPVGAAPDTVWILTPEEIPLANDDLLDFGFETATITVGADNRPLQAVMQDERFVFVGYDDAQTIRAFYVVDLPAVQQAGGLTWDDIMGLPTLPFVTITWQGLNPNRELTFDVWFHLDRDPRQNTHGLVGDRPIVEVFTEPQTDPAPPGVPTLGRFSNAQVAWQRRRHNVFQARIGEAVWKEVTGESPYFRFVFPTEANRVVDLQTRQERRLEEFINDPAGRTKFEGHNGKGTIVAYVRIPDNLGGQG